MLGKEIIMKELTELDLEASSCQELFETMAPKFMELGYVKDTYLESIIKREDEYPTALPVEPVPIAIPHTAAEHILKPFVAPIRFKGTVPWGEMANPDVVHDVKFAFMLGFKDPGEHIELLQILMFNFQKEGWISRLAAAQTLDEFYDIVMEMEWRYE